MMIFILREIKRLSNVRSNILKLKNWKCILYSRIVRYTLDILIYNILSISNFVYCCLKLVFDKCFSSILEKVSIYQSISHLNIVSKMLTVV